ncbi:MAG TPA: ABC transporter permease [Bacillota bacterium]|nr:ABC transporter permease [Bacillota bacterium]
MLRLVLRRVVEAIPTLILITMLSFLLIRLVPGGPVTAMLGDLATPQLIAQLTHSLGLDKPIMVQYVIWLGQLIHGNFGYSYTVHASVLQLIGQNLPRTLLLVITAIIISHVFAIAIGIYQATHRGSWVDHALTGLVYFLYSMPTFWLGIILVSIFAYKMGILPSGGITNPNDLHPSLAALLAHLVLPVATLVLVTMAGWSRYVRTSMSEALVQDYVRTAEAKGVSRQGVLVRHAFKNALLPLITLVGLSLPFLFSGSIIIEQVFNYPGMGLLFWDAAGARDYPILQGIVLIIGVLTVLGNLLADIMYGWADPRIRYD